jgi:hypothetical protein
MHNKEEVKQISNQNLRIDNLSEVYDFIAELKRFDYSLIQTMSQLRRKLNLSLFEVQNIVLNSPTWISEKDNFIEFNNQVWEALKADADQIKNNEDGTITITKN